MRLDLLARSITCSEDLKFRCTGEGVSPWYSCAIHASRVEPHATEWGFTAPGTTTRITPESIEVAVSLREIGEGLFQFDALDVWREPPEPAPQGSPISFVFKTPERLSLTNPILFEIRGGHSPPRSDVEIEAEHDELLQAREREFLAGFGRTNESDTQEFRVHVFGRDCMLSRVMRLPQCEVTPGPDLYPETEDRLLVREMKQRNYFPNVLTPEDARNLSVPSVRIFFPRVFAYDDADAALIAETAAQEILDVIALHRGAHPTVVGSFVEAAGGTSVRRFLQRASYRGSPLGGVATGEDSLVVRRDLERLRATPSLRLQAQLYRDARRERDPRMSYFRYWGFLETVAWARNLNDASIVEWDGTLPPGKAQKVGNAPKRLVSELLRMVVGPGSGERWSKPSDASLATGRIAVWYRNRNCIAHGGFCLCYPAAGQRGKSQDYEPCFAAKQDALAIGFDVVKSDLEAIARAVLRYQFNTP